MNKRKNNLVGYGEIKIYIIDHCFEMPFDRSNSSKIYIFLPSIFWLPRPVRIRSSLGINLNKLMSLKDFECLRMFDRINKSYADANDLSIDWYQFLRNKSVGINASWTWFWGNGDFWNGFFKSLKHVFRTWQSNSESCHALKL